MQNRNPLEVKAEETNRRHPCKTEPWHFHTAVAYPQRAILIFNGGKVVIREFCPLLFDSTRYLLPIAYKSFPVHGMAPD
jgi:hypothetical protein